MKNSTFEYVYYFALLLLGAFGLYSFVSMKLWEDMLVVNDFKFFDYEQNPLVFYLKYLLISLVVYEGLILLRKICNKKINANK